MKWKVPLYKISHDDNDRQALLGVLDRGTDWANGPELSALENALTAYVGQKFAVSFNNGTSALHAMLLAHGIGPGDEIIVPSFTFVSTANSVIFVGATPVFADIEETTYALDPEDVRRKITPKTKAIILVHYAGCPAASTMELRELANDKSIILFEDNAESLGSKFHGKMTGSFGESAILSFCANKTITSGEGGAVLTDSEVVYDKLMLLRSHGRDEKGKVSHFNSTSDLDYVTLGFNFRMSSFTAALALSQLKKIDHFIERRRSIAKTYDSAFEPYVQVMPNSDDLSHSYQMYTIRLPDRSSRELLKKHLEKAEIFSKVYFPPVHKTYFYKTVLNYAPTVPITEKVSDEVLTIPLYPSMTEDNMQLVMDGVLSFFRK